MCCEFVPRTFLLEERVLQCPLSTHASGSIKCANSGKALPLSPKPFTYKMITTPWLGELLNHLES